MKLYALSDLHLNHPANLAALNGLRPHPGDWLILAGDIGHSNRHLQLALEAATDRFDRVIWAPGNHDLWSTQPDSPRGVARYEEAIRTCRRYGVLTPEDPFPAWPGEGGPCIIAPLFVLYDYSFRPPSVEAGDAVAWARRSGVRCADERFLDPTPYPTRQAWCEARCDISERRLAAAAASHPLVIVNHFPLREELVRLRRIPRFSLWCGTLRTHLWHLRFRARVVVSGHLHIRSTDWIDGVRFEEVSLGYPQHWRREMGLEGYLREILPGPTLSSTPAGPVFHR